MRRLAAAPLPLLLPLLLLLAAAAAGSGAGAAAPPAVKVSPGVLPHTRSPMTVSWSGVAGARAADRLEAWLEPGGGSPGVYLGFVRVGDADRVAPGFSAGSHTLTLFNPRVGGYVFRYVRNGTSVAVAASAPASYAEPNEPTGVRLSQTGTHGEMRVMWTTLDELAGQAVVQYGASPDSLNRAAVSQNARHYTIDDMCGAPANSTATWIEPGYFQSAVMELLPSEAGRRVYYRVGAASGAAPWSEVMSFLAPPVPAAGVKTALIVYGDMGVRLPLVTSEEQQPAALKVAALVAKDVRGRYANVPVAVAHIGDISYSRGHPKYQKAFMQLVEPISSAAFYAVSYGNHEYDFPATPSRGFYPWRPNATWANFGTDSGGECGVVMGTTFGMPPGVGDNVAYSFEHGNIHVLLFSAEHNFLPGSKQHEFIEADLASVNRSRTPWVVVGTHRPFYSSQMGHTIEASRPHGTFDDTLRAAVEPLLLKYEVDVATVGHVHSYERTEKMVSNFTVAREGEQSGTVHVLVGSGGNDYNPNWEGSQPGSPPAMNNQTDPEDRHHAQPDWSVFRTMNNGYSRFETNATHLVMEFVGAQRGQVHDTLVLPRKNL